MVQPKTTDVAELVEELFEEHPDVNLPEHSGAVDLPPRLRQRRTNRLRPESAPTPRPTRRARSAKQLREQPGDDTVGRATKSDQPAVEEHPVPPNDAPVDPGEEQARSKLSAFAAELDVARQRLRADMEQALNAYLATQNPKSIQDKDRIAAIVGGLLGKLGMSIDYEGRPCSLYTTSGKKDRNGRFRLVPLGTKDYVILSAKLPDFLPLKLMDSPFAIVLNHTAGDDLPIQELWQNRVSTSAATRSVP